MENLSRKHIDHGLTDDANDEVAKNPHPADVERNRRAVQAVGGRGGETDRELHRDTPSAGVMQPEDKANRATVPGESARQSRLEENGGSAAPINRGESERSQ